MREEAASWKPGQIWQPPTRSQRWYDGAFRRLCFIFAAFTIVLIAWLVLEIAFRAMPAFRQYGISFIYGTTWDPNKAQYGILPEIWGTLYTSLLALVIGSAFGVAAAIFLSEGFPGGPGRPDLAVALLKKGIAAQPDNWRYYHDIAFVQYWQLHDTKTAAEWFRLAQKQPGAPAWLEPVAASMLIEGGDRQSARVILQQILNSPEEWLQQMARRALLQLDALDLIDRARPVIVRNAPPAGTPYSWQWLIQRGVVSRIPEDETGVPFEIDPSTGALTVSPRSQLFPMPRTGPPQ